MNYYARKSSGGQGIICDEDTGRTVAVVYDDRDLALLAAAPALLAALEYAMREVEGYEQRTGAHQFCHWITTARGAIAQAKEEGRKMKYRAQSGKPTLKGDEMTTNKLYMVIFGLLGLILLPVTGLWALFAYLAGDKYPLYALRGENVDDDLIDETIDNP